MNSTIQQFVSPDVKSNRTLTKAHIITNRLSQMGLQSVIYADTPSGGSPNPSQQFNEQWLLQNGCDPDNDNINLFYVLGTGGNQSGNEMNVGRTLDQYFSGGVMLGATNSYDAWTKDMNLPNDYSKIPGVNDIVKAFMSES